MLPGGDKQGRLVGDELRVLELERGIGYWGKERNVLCDGVFRVCSGLNKIGLGSKVIDRRKWRNQAE